MVVAPPEDQKLNYFHTIGISPRVTRDGVGVALFVKPNRDVWADFAEIQRTEPRLKAFSKCLLPEKWVEVVHPELKPRRYLQNGYKSLETYIYVYIFCPLSTKEQENTRCLYLCSINETFITLHHGECLFSLGMNHQPL